MLPTYSRAREPINALYYIDGELLNRVHMLSDLGICFDQYVSIAHNAFELCNLVRKVLGYIIRQTQYLKTRNALCDFNKAYVHS